MENKLPQPNKKTTPGRNVQVNKVQAEKADRLARIAEKRADFTRLTRRKNLREASA